jgi:hypothetical protein
MVHDVPESVAPLTSAQQAQEFHHQALMKTGSIGYSGIATHQSVWIQDLSQPPSFDGAPPFATIRVKGPIKGGKTHLQDHLLTLMANNPHLQAVQIRLDQDTLEDILSNLNPYTTKSGHGKQVKAYARTHEQPPREPPRAPSLASTLISTQSKMPTNPMVKKGWSKEPLKFRWEGAAASNPEEELILYSLSTTSKWQWNIEMPSVTTPYRVSSHDPILIPFQTPIPLILPSETPITWDDANWSINTNLEDLLIHLHVHLPTCIPLNILGDMVSEVRAQGELFWCPQSNIFNATNPTDPNRHDTPERQAIYTPYPSSKPTTIASDPTDGLVLRDLPSLRAVVEWFITTYFPGSYPTPPPSLPNRCSTSHPIPSPSLAIHLPHLINKK